MELAGARFPDILTDLPLCDLNDASRLFDEVINPAQVRPTTRVNYFRLWSTFVTFALLWGALDHLTPISQTLLKGFLLCCVQANYKPASIELFLAAIIYRHKRFGIPLGFTVDWAHKCVKALKKNIGIPKHRKYKISVPHFKAILIMPKPNLIVLQDAVMVLIGVACSLRLSELIDLDLCDLIFDIDGPHTLGINVKRRKQDHFREGLRPRIGPPNDPRFDLISLVRQLLKITGRLRSVKCEKHKWPTETCRSCGPLFRSYKISKPRDYKGRVTRSYVATALRETLRRIGVEPDNFSPISMRKGGISAAVCANIHPDLYTLQTGHTSLSRRDYVELGPSDNLYQFWRALRC